MVLGVLEILVHLDFLDIELLGCVDHHHAHWLTGADKLDPFEGTGESAPFGRLVSVDIAHCVDIYTGVHLPGVSGERLTQLVHHSHLSVATLGLLLGGGDIPGVGIEACPVFTVLIGEGVACGGPVGFVVKPVVQLRRNLTKLLDEHLLTDVSELGPSTTMVLSSERMNVPENLASPPSKDLAVKRSLKDRRTFLILIFMVFNSGTFRECESFGVMWEI